MIRRLAGTFVVALILAGCGGSSAPSKRVSAVELAESLEADIPSVTKVVKITEDNDPNNLIGRSNGYEQAAVVYDSRAECPDLGVACGATIEVFENNERAEDRNDYIQGILKGSSALGSEYGYVVGNALIRVAGSLKPSEAKEYEDAAR